MKTLHRNAARAKHQAYPLIPKFWQPKVKPEVQSTCRIIHWNNITSISKGLADEPFMWEWVECCLTYKEMMRLLIKDGVQMTPEAQAAIAEQLECWPVVVKRYRATGLVGFTGTELNIARAAAHVMDELIGLDRNGIAWAARTWSNLEMPKVKLKF
jgi:hypothetical protein